MGDGERGAGVLRAGWGICGADGGMGNLTTNGHEWTRMDTNFHEWGMGEGMGNGEDVWVVGTC